MTCSEPEDGRPPMPRPAHRRSERIIDTRAVGEDYGAGGRARENFKRAKALRRLGGVSVDEEQGRAGRSRKDVVKVAEKEGEWEDEAAR